MKRLIPILLVVAIAAALLVALTSGGTSNANDPIETGARPGAGPSPAAALGLRSTPLGRILVDARGRTLYLFERDKPNMSNCSSACLGLWPALSAHGTPAAHAGVRAADIGTIAMASGQRQVTYDRHPLYYYVGDRKPGDTAGQGLDQFGAKWYVLGASGHAIDDD